MADNIAATPGVGATIAFDEIGGVQYQRVKVTFGADGASTDVASGAPLPVTAVLSAVAAGTPIQTVPGLKTTEQLTRAAISCSSSGDNTLIGAVASQFVRVYALIFTVDTPVSVKLGDTTVAYFTGAMKFGLGGGLLLSQQGEPHFITAIGKGLVLNLSSAVQCSGVVWYQQGT